jgi:hypothetical protein
MAQKISGWILPDGKFEPCEPWCHVQVAKSLPWLRDLYTQKPFLFPNWDTQNDEELRQEIAQSGLCKVCYFSIDTNYLTPSQLVTLQELYGGYCPAQELLFVGGINLTLEIRLLLKLRSPDRINQL